MVDVSEWVKDTLCEYLGVIPEFVRPEKAIVDDLGADSLDTVELVMAVEDEFDTEILDEEAEKIVTVQDMINLIESKVRSNE